MKNTKSLTFPIINDLTKNNSNKILYNSRIKHNYNYNITNKLDNSVRDLPEIETFEIELSKDNQVGHSVIFLFIYIIYILTLSLYYLDSDPVCFRGWASRLLATRVNARNFLESL